MFSPLGIHLSVSYSLTAGSAEITGAQKGNGAVRVTGGVGTTYMAFGDSSVTVSPSTGIPVGTAAQDFLIPAGATHVAFVATGNSPDNPYTASVQVGYKG